MNRHERTGESLAIELPRADRSLEIFQLSEPKHFPDRQNAKLNRVAFAAAHVVADPDADNDPWLDCAIDWDKTIAFREHLWGLGLGVAEAMDTAQRGMGAMTRQNSRETTHSRLSRIWQWPCSLVREAWA